MGTRVSHAVTVVTQTGAGLGRRQRGECVCGWVSPWSTSGPAWVDAQPRAAEFTLGVISRAAAFHLRSPALGG